MGYGRRSEACYAKGMDRVVAEHRRPRGRVAIALLVTGFVPAVALAMGACTSTASTTPPGAAADAAQDAPPLDAGIVGEAETPDGTSDASDGGQARTGSVFVVSESGRKLSGQVGHEHRVGASFYDGPATQEEVVRETVGSCVVEHITFREQPLGRALSAGRITVTGGTLPLSLTPDPDGTYPTTGGPISLWSGGETLALAAAGGEVPAFQASLVAPSPITVTQPVRELGDAGLGRLSVVRASGLTLTWTGSSQGTFQVYLSTAEATMAHAVTCTFASSTGTATVPAAALLKLPAGSGFFDLYVEEKTEVTVPGWAVTFTATRGLQDSADWPMTGVLDLQ